MRILLLLVLTFNVYAEIVQIERSGNSILLVSDSCEKNNSQATAFNSLVKLSLQTPSCECDDGMCMTDITGVTPKIYKELLYNHAKYEGPNCWNAALLGAGSISSIRYVDDGEIKEILNSPICKKIYNKEDISPGDIITIKKRSPTSDKVQELHGFTYLTDSGSFNKDNGNVTKPYVLASVSSIFEDYNLPKSCHLNDKCQLFTEAHRCQSISSALEEVHDLKAREIYKESLKVSCIVNEMFLGNRLFSDELFNMLNLNMQIVRQMFSEIEPSEYKNMLEYQIDSIEKSLRDIKDFEENFSINGEVVDFSDTDNNLFMPVNYDQNGSRVKYENYIENVKEKVLSGTVNDFSSCEFFSFLKKHNIDLGSSEIELIKKNKRLSKVYSKCN